MVCQGVFGRFPARPFGRSAKKSAKGLNWQTFWQTQKVDLPKVLPNGLPTGIWQTIWPRMEWVKSEKIDFEKSDEK